MSHQTLECAGRPLQCAREDIRRYCGLPWSGRVPETWAYAYFDSVPTAHDEQIAPLDVLACAALQPGLGASDLAFFNEDGAEACRQWLARAPKETELADADEDVVRHVVSLIELANGVGLSLLTKVIQRKRPRLVPMFDRAVVDWYRPVTKLRGEVAWSELVRCLRSDLAAEGNRRVLAGFRKELEAELAGPVPSDLRLADIAIWMAGRGR